jgi:iron complex outermembrane receptor protein
VYGIDARNKVVPMGPGLTPLTAASYLAAVQSELATQNANGPRTVFYDFGSWNKRKNLYFTNTTTYDITDKIDAKVILGYVDIVEDQASTFLGGNTAGFLTCHSNCGDGSTLPFKSQKQYSGEFRLAGQSFDDKLTWSLGTYWDLQLPSGAFQNNDITLGVLRRTSVFYSKTRSAAGYGYAEYDFADIAPGLKINGGIRYTEDSIKAFGATYLRPIDAPLLEPTLRAVIGAIGLPQSVATATLAPIPYGRCENYGGFFVNTCDAFEGNWHAWTYTAGASYEFGGGQMVYAKYSKGYRPGGVNSAPVKGLDPTYDPEIDKSLEFGLKADWQFAGMSARTNLAVYHDKYSNIQKSVTTLISNVVSQIVTNVAEATIQGVEFEGTLIPTDGLTLGMTAALTDARYKNRDPALLTSPTSPCSPTVTLNVGFCSYDRFPLTPKYQISGSARWVVPLDEELGEISIGGKVYYQSDIAYGPIMTTPNALEDGYALLDLYAEWKDAFGQPIDMTLFVNNATDKTYRAASQDLSHRATIGIRSAVYGPPRLYGLSVRYKFGAAAN